MEITIADFTIRRGTPEEYGEILDFANMVFRLDFKSLLPKLYDGHPESARHHYLIRSGGRLCAMAGSFPMKMNVAGWDLDVCGIGTVSVHPYARGGGYMRALMENIVADARADGADMMLLSGDRQRYEYYGFSPCGADWTFDVSPANLRHCRPAGEPPEILPLAECPQWIDDCRLLYEAQDVTVERPDMIAALSSWSGAPYALCMGGKLLGYFVYTDAGRQTPLVSELRVKDPAFYRDAILWIAKWAGGKLQAACHYGETEMLSALGSFCEHCRLDAQPQYQVFSYRRVIAAFLTLKSSRRGLEDGQTVLEVQGVGKYRIRCENGRVAVDETAEAPDISLPPLDMMRRVFSPLWTGAPEKADRIQRDFFPIPLCFPIQDRV